MKKKNICIFLLISMLCYSFNIVSGVENELSNKGFVQKNEVKSTFLENYPDLIVKLTIKIEQDPIFGFLRVLKIFINVKNIGDKVAIFPESSIYLNIVHIIAISNETFDIDIKILDDLILYPGEEYKDLRYRDFLLGFLGDIFLTTIDPYNIVEEGNNGGEDNNVHYLKIKFFNKDNTKSSSILLNKNQNAPINNLQFYEKITNNLSLSEGMEK